MNILIFNYSHPDEPHISAKRMSYFARHLAERGHKVVLVTKTIGTDLSGLTSRQANVNLQEHDWSTPYLLAVSPKGSPYLEIVRGSRTPPLVRRAILLYLYLFKQGRVFGDWSDQVVHQLAQLGQFFKPDISWGTFGNVDTLWLTKKSAHFFGIPYVIDIKDPWRYFVTVFRKRLAAQFEDAAGVTINSSFQITHSLPWFKNPTNYHLLYSGIDTNKLRSAWRTAEPIAQSSLFTIMLVGSIYKEALLGELFSGICRWTVEVAQPLSLTVQVTYAGADMDKLERYMQGKTLPFQVKLAGFLPYEDLFKLYASSSIIAYIHHTNTFHHKLIELLALNRPILSFPGESVESIALAKKYEAKLLVCSTQDNVMLALNQVANQPLTEETTLNEAILTDFRWENSTHILEKALTAVLGRAPFTIY